MANPMNTTAAAATGNRIFSLIEKGVNRMMESQQEKNEKKQDEYDERMKIANEEQERMNRELEASIQTSNKHHDAALDHMNKTGQLHANMMKGIGAATINLYSDLGYFQNNNGNQEARLLEVGNGSANQQMFTGGRPEHHGHMNPGNGMNGHPTAQPTPQEQHGHMNPGNGMYGGPTFQPTPQEQRGHMNPGNGMYGGPTFQPTPQDCISCGSLTKVLFCRHFFCPKCHVNDNMAKCPRCEKVYPCERKN